MNNYLWLVVMPNFGKLLDILGGFGLIVFITALFIFVAFKDLHGVDDHKQTIKSLSNILLMSIMMFFIGCFIPSKKEIIELRAISIISEVNGADQIPKKIVDKLNDLLEAK